MHLKLEDFVDRKDGLLVKIVEDYRFRLKELMMGGEYLQAGFNTATVSNGSAGPSILASAGSESFDEPLTTQQVVSNNLFIV
jgi:hypothetical protein